jgi:hypothetical protein
MRKLLQIVLMLVSVFALQAHTLQAQVMVDEKNITEDQSIEYIQLAFFYEKKNFKPQYSIDYGIVFPDDKEFKNQKISIDGEIVTDKMTPVWILNKLHKSGWEYIADAVFMPAPMIDNSQVYTFRRKISEKPADGSN